MNNGIYTVGLTGGIGSGKSTLARMFLQRGAAVYSADPRAKELMTTDPALKTGILSLFGDQAYLGTELNREHIARQVFSEPELLARLDALVHPAVYRDFEHWRLCQNAPYAVLESAILFESGGQAHCDITAAVCIPLELRIARTMERDGASRQQVLQRMERQMSDRQRASLADIVIRAENLEEKEHQADRLDALFRRYAAERIV